MPFEDTRSAGRWPARLALGFAARGGATVLAHRAHAGPLVVQKALHPEGPRVCHAILVHPPSGLAGGDRLDVALTVGAGAHALVTTPGAGKWYRSTGAMAAQALAARVAGGAVLEWLPQEAIVYDGARASMAVEVDLDADGAYIGMEILCLGRTARGERYARGEIALAATVRRDGRALWIERGRIAGGDPLLVSPVGLDGQPVTATLLAASPLASPDLVAACRALPCAAGRGAVTLLPGLVVARWLGPACEPARAWLAAVWGALRPALAGRAAVAPRIWST